MAEHTNGDWQLVAIGYSVRFPSRTYTLTYSEHVTTYPTSVALHQAVSLGGHGTVRYTGVVDFVNRGKRRIWEVRDDTRNTVEVDELFQADGDTHYSACVGCGQTTDLYRWAWDDEGGTWTTSGTYCAADCAATYINRNGASLA